MTASPSSSYPVNANFAALLRWHMDIWGTRPDGNTERSGKPWTIKEFAFAVHGDSLKLGSPEKNVANWRDENKGPPRNRTTIQAIESALFGDKPGFDGWKNDLRLARDRSGAHGRNTSDKPAQSHFAASARENVAFIVSRLGEFVGRADDLESIDQFVASRMAGASQSLLVITAPPGFGKSALAAHWCTEAGRAPNRSIAYHFCSAITGRATTAPENIYANLHRQVADAMGAPIHASASLDALTTLLGTSPPDDRALVLWLDGIDESDELLDCFLPMHMGARICVIVSARADKEATPSFLVPWLAKHRLAEKHNPVRHHLNNLSRSDVGQMVDRLFAKSSIPVPENLAWVIFNVSKGHALFARMLTEDGIEAFNKGERNDPHASSKSLQDYAKREIRKLESLDTWPVYQQLFVFLTIAKEPVTVSDIPKFIGIHPRRIYPDAFPYALRRWLSITEAPNSQRALISFAHPLLAEIFGRAVSYGKFDAVRTFCDAILQLPYSDWPIYAMRHLPHHLSHLAHYETSYHEKLVSLLADVDFTTARYNAVRTESVEHLMFEDWYNCLQTCSPATRENLYSIPMRHFRHWKNMVRVF